MWKINRSVGSEENLNHSQYLLRFFVCLVFSILRNPVKLSRFLLIFEDFSLVLGSFSILCSFFLIYRAASANHWLFYWISSNYSTLSVEFSRVLSIVCLWLSLFYMEFRQFSGISTNFFTFPEFFDFPHGFLIFPNSWFFFISFSHILVFFPIPVSFHLSHYLFKFHFINFP